MCQKVSSYYARENIFLRPSLKLNHREKEAILSFSWVSSHKYSWFPPIVELSHDQGRLKSNRNQLAEATYLFRQLIFKSAISQA